jgi:hypothetical protein
MPIDLETLVDAASLTALLGALVQVCSANAARSGPSMLVNTAGLASMNPSPAHQLRNFTRLARVRFAWTGLPFVSRPSSRAMARRSTLAMCSPVQGRQVLDQMALDLAVA